MFRIFCTIAFFSISQLSQSAEFTAEQLIAGVNQARNQIRTGEMRIIITFDYEAKKTPEEIQALRQEEKKENFKRIFNASPKGNPEGRTQRSPLLC